MRKIYLLINFVLLVLLFVLLAANFQLRPPPPDPALRWAPENFSPVVSGTPKTPQTGNVAAIRQKNLFNPLRGEAPQKSDETGKGQAAPPRFELIGLCTIGDTAGAIIDSKNPDSNGKSEKQKRRYYAIGSEVWGGFILDSVAENSAILKRKNETLEIKINRSRFSAEVGKNSSSGTASPRPAPTPPPPIPPPQRGPGIPPPGVNP